MEVDTYGLVIILKRIQKRLNTFEESFALGCAIDAVRELDRIQSESSRKPNRVRRRESDGYFV